MRWIWQGPASNCDFDEYNWDKFRPNLTPLGIGAPGTRQKFQNPWLQLFSSIKRWITVVAIFITLILLLNILYFYFFALEACKCRDNGQTSLITWTEILCTAANNFGYLVVHFGQVLLLLTGEAGVCGHDGLRASMSRLSWCGDGEGDIADMGVGGAESFAPAGKMIGKRLSIRNAL